MTVPRTYPCVGPVTFFHDSVESKQSALSIMLCLTMQSRPPFFYQAVPNCSRPLKRKRQIEPFGHRSSLCNSFARIR